MRGARHTRVALVGAGIVAGSGAGCWTGDGTTPASEPREPTPAEPREPAGTRTRAPLQLATSLPAAREPEPDPPPPPSPSPPLIARRPPVVPPPPPPSGLRVKAHAPRVVTSSPLGLAAGLEHRIEGLCVSGTGRVVVPDGAVLTFTGDRPIVIGGGGVTPARGVTHLHVQIVALEATEVFLLFDNLQVPIDALVYAPKATVDIGLTGKTGLNLVKGGVMATAKYNAAWGLPPSFPTCPYP